MPLDSFALEAFQTVAREGTFTRAAAALHITQSALSQRVSGLESVLGTTLFLRTKQGATLTPAGKRLLRYALAKSSLEEELLGDLSEGDASLEGTVRVTGFSSIVRSVLLPALAPLLRAHSGLRLELQSREIEEVGQALLSGETDFALQFEKMPREGLKVEMLGAEEYVLVEARKGPVADAFLDHHESDTVSLLYLNRFDPGKTKVLRRYLDDAYGLLDGAALGLGRAVLPLHMVRGDRRLRILQPQKVLRLPVHLHSLALPYTPRWHDEVLQAIRSEFSRRLGEKSA
jgi:DNA-binding transcriptional LysR family regulator